MEGYIAEIRMFGGNFAPRNWAFCSGQLISIAQNSALFSILGTTYGGNGQTTFGLPDMRGRVPVHAGQGAGLSNYVLGEKAGVEKVTLTTNQMPTHNHGAQATITAHVGVLEDDGNTQEVAGHVLSNSPSEQLYSSDAATGQLGGVSATGTVTVDFNGGSQSHENRMPLLVVNFIICLYGIFPSRS